MEPIPEDEPPSSPEVDVRIASGVQQRFDPAWIILRLREAAQHLEQHDDLDIRRVHLLIVDDARMTHLHERHSGIADTTDVLTFDLRSDPSQPIEADIVVCADEAARCASEFGHPIERELLLYGLHGLLHCAGFDDHDQQDWKLMHAREDDILAAIGVGPTFDRSSQQRTHEETGGS